MAKILIGRTLDQSTDSVTVAQGDAGAAAWPVGNLNQLVPEEHDHIELGYTGSNLTSVVYKQGGSGGTVVATLALTYSGDRLQTVTRT
jgi:hypothetical protein